MSPGRKATVWVLTRLPSTCSEERVGPSPLPSESQCPQDWGPLVSTKWERADTFLMAWGMVKERCERGRERMVEDIPKSTGKQPKYPEAPLLFIPGTLTAAGRGGASSAKASGSRRACSVTAGGCGQRAPLPSGRISTEETTSYVWGRGSGGPASLPPGVLLLLVVRGSLL